MLVASFNPTYRFGHFEVQAGERRLLINGEPLAIGPRAFDVLLVLVERGGSLVNKDELLSRVWPNVVVEENALQAQISLIRRLIGRESIATVSGSGYRFTPAVKAASNEDAKPPNHNLPQPLTSFIGREAQLRELTQVLEQSRLVTLTGAGGCGKTRLVVELTRTLSSHYPDGYWFVDLSALTEPESVVYEVANVLSLSGKANQSLPETIADYLSTRTGLLILDNVEHLLVASADLVEHLLRTCPKLVVVATGREPMRVEGECVYRVPSLTLSEVGREEDPALVLTSEAARLFSARVKLHSSDFHVTTWNASAVASVCRRLDGIPLAIELAAARVRMMTVQDLDRRLNKRFSLLTSGQRNAVPRHLTLRSLIDWSYDLLTPVERALLSRMSVFAGGFDLEAAEDVCAYGEVDRAQILTIVESLVDKNLLHTEDRKGVMRFGLRETIRQYTTERAGEQANADTCHCRYLEHYVQKAKAFKPLLIGPEQSQAFDRLDLDHDNFRAVLSHCCGEAGRAALGLAVAASIWRFWSVRGYLSEGRHWCSRLLALPSAADQCANRGEALNGYGVLLFQQGERHAARTVWEDALQLERVRGDVEGVARALRNLGAFAYSEHLDDEAKEFLLEALELSRRSDQKRNIAMNLINLGSLAIRQKDYSQQSGEYYLEAGRLFQAIGDRHAATTASFAYATWLQHHDVALAISGCLDALVSFQELGDPWWTASVFDRFGLMALNAGLPHHAGVMIGAADRIDASIGGGRQNRPDVEDIVGFEGPGDLRIETFQAARDAGRAMNLDEATAFACSDEFKRLVGGFWSDAASSDP